MDLSLENTETPLSAFGLRDTRVIGELFFHLSNRLLATEEYMDLEEIDGQRKDHRAITFDRKIFELLESYTGLLTIENYHKRLLETSLEILSEYY